MRAVLLSDKKTGSTFVQYAINSHPDLTCYDEMFIIKHGDRRRRGQFLYKTMKKEKNFSIVQYLDWLYSQEKNVCFRLMYPHDVHWGVLSYIIKRKIPIIHLVRENHFKKVISKYTYGKVMSENIDIKPEQIIRSMKESINNLKKYRKKLSGYKNVFEIKYEDMVTDIDGELNINKIKNLGGSNITSNVVSYMNEDYCKMICDLFDVEYRRLYSNVTKKNKIDVFNCLKNKNKIRKVMKSNNLDHYLEMK